MTRKVATADMSFNFEPPPQSKRQKPSCNRVIQVIETWATLRLGPKLVVQIDLIDLPQVMKHRWHIDRDPKYTHLRIQTNQVISHHRYKKISLQRLVLNPKEGMIAKLKYSQLKLDYRRSNLELVSAQDQSRRCRKRKVETSSIYRGISYRKERDKWAAMIQVNRGQHLLIGYFDDEHEAAVRWNRASLKYFGESGYQNVIEIKQKRNRRAK